MSVSSRLVTLTNFPGPTEAGFIKNLLEAEGIHAYLADDVAVGMVGYLGNAMGWVKLQVAEDDLERANEILEAHRQTIADVGPEAFAAEATSAVDTDEIETEASGSSAAEEGDDDDTVDPMDELAWRALRAAGLGLMFVPLTFYAAWLIGRLIFSKGELSSSASWKLWLAFALVILVFGGYWAFFFVR